MWIRATSNSCCLPAPLPWASALSHKMPSVPTRQPSLPSSSEAFANLLFLPQTPSPPTSCILSTSWLKRLSFLSFQGTTSLLRYYHSGLNTVSLFLGRVFSLADTDSSVQKSLSPAPLWSTLWADSPLNVGSFRFFPRLSSSWLFILSLGTYIHPTTSRVQSGNGTTPVSLTKRN